MNLKVIDFEDKDRKEIRVQLSSADGYRIYIGNREDSSTLQGIHLNDFQARILINALEDLMKGID